MLTIPSQRMHSMGFASRILGLTMILFAGLVANPASAQQTSCDRIKRDLVALQAETPAKRANQLRRQSQRSIAQAQRIAQEMEQIGCGNSRFLLWGSDPPPQCGAMSGRIAELNQRARTLAAQAERPIKPDNRKLKQLQAAYESRGCEQPQQTASAETPLPMVDIVEAPPSGADAPVLPISNSAAEQRAASYASGAGAPGAVCVRLCDGYFFPLSGARSRAQAGEMCQAQCPATETHVYFRRSSSISTAFAMNGTSYSSLPNALAFQKTFNPDCSCRQTGESWRDALQQAETLVSARGKPDLIVDEKIAANWPSVQKEFLAGRGKKDKKPDLARGEADTAAPDETTASLPDATLSEPELRAEEPPDPQQAKEPALQPAEPSEAASEPVPAQIPDQLGSVIEELQVPEEEQPFPDAVIDPVPENRETVVRLLDDLPPPDGSPAQ